MNVSSELQKIASIVGDPVRAKILWTLMDQNSCTASELLLQIETSPQNMSMHLKKLILGDLVKMKKQGRHKHYSLAGKEVAYAIEALTGLIPEERIKVTESKERLSPVRYCRSCYDHLAGKVGVAIRQSLSDQKIIIERNGTFVVTKKGEKFFKDMKINLGELRRLRRSFARPCLDWSERRYHLAGSLGAALLNKMFESGWLRRTKNSRIVSITAEGQKRISETFGIIV